MCEPARCDIYINQPLHNLFPAYLSEPVSVSAQYDSLDWWKANELKFPRVAVISRRYLAIPPTSVASERLFSLSGRVITKGRNRLLPEIATAIVFLNKNGHVFDSE